MSAEAKNAVQLQGASRSKVWVTGGLILLAVYVLDQITKWLALRMIGQLEVIPVIPEFFNLTLTFNPGIAFGLLGGMDAGVRYLLLASVTLIALGVIIYLYIGPFKRDFLARTALAMILGGALGNITDRILYGAVVDFLDFYISHYHWPAFNVADSAICIGVTILLFRNPSNE